VNHIDLNAQGEPVKQFFLSLPADREGSLVEVNGRAVARVVPISTADAGDSTDEDTWTKEKNGRRCFLIDREIDGTLTPEEGRELDNLQRQMLQYRRRVAPLPLEDLRRLHEELLAKAEAAQRG
jgi:hypothetical protein